MQKNIELVALIYKSTKYLDHIVNELKNTKADGWDVNYRIIANDATERVLNKLKNDNINHTIYNDKNINDYYLNRVYRAWNFGIESSRCENVCLVNSDMMMHPEWLSNLLMWYDPKKNIPVSRLVESTKLKSGTHAIEMNFGKHPDELRRQDFLNYVESIKQDRTEIGGLYGCPVFNRNLFIKSGKYPEGNLYKMQDGSIQIGKFGKGTVVESGDSFYFREMKRRFNIDHITVFDSLVYHIQEGEMDE